MCYVEEVKYDFLRERDDASICRQKHVSYLPMATQEDETVEDEAVSLIGDETWWDFVHFPMKESCETCSETKFTALLTTNQIIIASIISFTPQVTNAAAGPTPQRMNCCVKCISSKLN